MLSPVISPIVLAVPFPAPILSKSVIRKTTVTLALFVFTPGLPLFASSLWAVSSMAPYSQPVRSDNKENQTDASSDLTEIFSDSRSDSEDSDDKDESSDNISDDKGQLPPENYLTQAESLNVSQSTRYGTGNRPQTQIRHFISCMHISAGRVISTNAAMQANKEST